MTGGQGQLVTADAFLKNLNPPTPPSTSQEMHAPPPVAGAAIRWAVAMDRDLSPQLELHGMPSPAATLQKKFFSGDNSVSVLLGTFPLNADMFPDTFAAGLIPLFFSPSPQQALAALSNNTDATKETINAVNSRFLVMEHMTLDSAVAHLKAKKGRLAKGVSAFPAPMTTRKRNKPATQDISRSGT